MEIAQYRNFVRKRYRAILLGPLLAGLAALIFTFTQPPVYEAEAQLAIVKSGVLLNFDPKYQSVSDVNSDQIARRRSLTTLAKSPALASVVINKISGQLDSTEQVPTRLVNAVDASLDGDLIRIKVRADSPQKAALIANTWVAQYRDQVNDIYGQETVTTTDLQTQLDEAQRDYDSKERALVSYLASSPIEDLTRQITVRQQQLTDLVTLQNKLDRLLSDATVLRSKLASGSPSTARGDELATLLLEASAFSTWSSLPVNLQIPIDQLSTGASPSDQTRNLDLLIATLQDRRTLVQSQVGGSLQKEISELQSQLEQANAQKQDLTLARDVSTAALTTLANKMSEVQLAAQSKASVVRLATAALPPTLPVSSSRTLTIMLAGLLGLLASMAVAVAFEFFDKTVGTGDAIQALLGLPVLASLQSGANQFQGSGPSPEVAESFLLLRYRLPLPAQTNTLLIAGASSAGTSSVAANLAEAYAQAGRTVTLVTSNGQSQDANESVEPAKLTQPSETPLASLPTPEALPRFVNGVRILHMHDDQHGYGAQHSKPEEFAALLQELKASSDIVLLDMQILSGAGGALLAAPLAKWCLLVVESNHTSRAQLVRVKELLEAAGAEILGVVLNEPSPQHRWNAYLVILRLAQTVRASRNGPSQIPATRKHRE